MKVLIIAPHLDDEIIGCGGFIAKCISKQIEVYICYVTEGKNFLGYNYKKNQDEKKQALKVCKFLGVKKAFFLNLPALKLDKESLFDINKKLSDCIKKVKPDIVLTSDEEDANEDHKIVYNSTLVASRPFVENYIKKIYTYETLSSTEWDFNNNFKPNTFVDISDFVETKKQALKKYKFVLRDFPHPRSLKAIEALAIYRGANAGMESAEAFRLVRDLKCLF